MKYDDLIWMLYMNLEAMKLTALASYFLFFIFLLLTFLVCVLDLLKTEK